MSVDISPLRCNLCVYGDLVDQGRNLTKIKTFFQNHVIFYHIQQYDCFLTFLLLPSICIINEVSLQLLEGEILRKLNTFSSEVYPLFVTLGGLVRWWGTKVALCNIL